MSGENNRDPGGQNPEGRGEAQIERAWRDASRELPPAHLDARILAAARASLGTAEQPGSAPPARARWNVLQESVSVRVLKITAGSPEFVFVDPEERARWLVAAGLRDVRARRLDRGRVHPHHLLVGRAAR